MKKYLICLVQLVILLVVGIWVKDSFLLIAAGLMGVAYSFLISMGKRYGYIITIVYCFVYAYINFKAKLYASAVFNIAVLLPSVIVSFITWGKKQKGGEVLLTSYNAKGRLLLFGVVAAVSVALFFLMKVIGSSNALLDTFFFTTGLCACYLGIACRKEVFFVLVVAGVVGTVMWTMQVISTATGYSILILNALVLINAIIGFVKFNTKKKEVHINGSTD